MPRHVPAHPSRSVIRRRRVAVVLAGGLVAAGAVAVAASLGSGPDPESRSGDSGDRVVSVTDGPRTVVSLPLDAGRAVDRRGLRAALVAELPAGVVTSRGRARIGYRYDVDLTVRRAAAVGIRGGRVEAVRVALTSRILAPIVRQAEPNTCESAALQILLATSGRRVAQARLQAALPTSGSLDPQGVGPERVWGDPDRGYVGRADGGGAAGGFGIYPGPVAATAGRFGRTLDDLTGSDPRRVYARLLRGRAVMAWIGLSDGPYGEWRSPAGRPIKVNFGEHTIVLNGMTRDGELRVVNPLEGTSELWSRDRFESSWALLGRRALGV